MMPKIIDLLKSGKTVFLSRYAFSGVVYSVSRGKMTLQEAISPDKGILIPSLTILLYTKPEELKDRFSS